MSSKRERVATLRTTVKRLILVLAAGVLVASVLTASTVFRLSRQREVLVTQLDPAAEEVRNLLASVVEQETGVQGYALGRDLSFLNPYLRGRSDEVRAVSQLESYLADYPELRADLQAVRETVVDWRDLAAEPIIAAATAGESPDQELLQASRSHFDSARAAIRELALGVDGSRQRISERLTNAFSLFVATLVTALGAMIFSIVSLYRGTKRQVLQPLDRLRSDARKVAGGELNHRVRPAGPQEMAELADAVEAMRSRILDELERLEIAHGELEDKAAEMDRSNRDLEQFAYVASHDLQEPLRKVASFCQLLQKRYGGRLDARADEYISYAVDGAQRMQQLINDLLQFSRVGLSPESAVAVDCNQVIDDAIAGLKDLVDETDALIERDELPTVSGDRNLLGLVFENLLTNALKFRSERRPTVRISASDAGGEWEFAVSDNGIGIDAQHAQRVFVIFQRLHARDEYPGTGIGLALVKRIVESHGGRVWLESTDEPGTTVRLTLPKRVLDDDYRDHPADPDPAH